MSEDDAADGEDDWFESAIRGEDDAEPSRGPDEGAVDEIGDDSVEGTSEHTGADAAGPPGENPAWSGTVGDAGVADADAPASDEEGLFEDDFATAFGAGAETFEDEEFDSAIPRIDVGIQGLDNMIRGGIPQRHLMAVIGSAGTGKTTFGLQFLQHGLATGENCVFITLEQSQESIIDTASEHGWDFEEFMAKDRLAVVDLDPIEMANSLDNIRGELPGLVEDFDADRFVLDSVSLLEMMYDEQASRRTEIYDFSRSLKGAGVTTLLTSEADEDNPYTSRYGIIEYLTDAVFVLRYVRTEATETRLAVEILKIRNANHSRETKPYEITDEGINVYEQANIF